jgi:hypothetical protein
MNHQVALAHYLMLDGRRDAARAVLERSLADHRTRSGSRGNASGQHARSPC